jgi:hypothetical protein
VPYRVVEHPSTDIARDPGIRDVDASDLAAFAQELGRPLSYGFGGSTPNWRCNVMPFDGQQQIDSSDLGAFAQDLNDPQENCTNGIPKADNEGQAILAWFGIVPTGNTIPIGPIGDQFEVPEYQVVDWEKLHNAISNPYGYKDHIGAGPTTPWTRVKSLYR